MLPRLRPRSAALALALCAIAATGCTRALTQIVLVVESELRMPSEIDRIEVFVLGPSGERATARAELGREGSPAAPFTLGITPAGTRFAPVHIRVVASRHGNAVVERVVRTAFQRDRSVELVVRLERACATTFCGSGDTCVGGECIDPYVPWDSLPIFTGPRPILPDGGVTCSGAPGAPEVCDGIDQDCDGTIDEGFDLGADDANCGVCGNACVDGVACLRGSCGDPAVQVAAGEVHTCAVRRSGHVACWGGNEVGQLGDDSRTDRARPVEVEGIDDAVAIGLGERHACVLGRDGRLRCWGWNDKGQLGDGTTETRGEPREVGLEGVVELGVGYEHTCARTSAGVVSCWGSRAGVDASTGALRDVSAPRTITGLDEPVALAPGNESTCVIEGSGRVVCWGQDASGRLGDGPPLEDRDAPEPILEPIAARGLGRFGFGYFAIAGDGEVWGWGENEHAQLARLGLGASASPITLVGVEGAVQVSGGRQHACARGEPGWVRCWGSDARGQLGRGEILGGVHPAAATVVGLPIGMRELATGSFHACVRTEGEVWCWGANDRGQLGSGSFADRARPVRAVLPGSTR